MNRPKIIAVSALFTAGVLSGNAQSTMLIEADVFIKNDPATSATEGSLSLDGSLKIGNAGPIAGTGNIAVGTNASVNGRGNVAIGNNSISGTAPAHVNSFAFGDAAEANSTASIAFGAGSKSNANNSVALGTKAETSGPQSVVIGVQAVSTAAHTAVLGRKAEAHGTYATAIGDASIAEGYASGAFGNGTRASGDNSYAMGYRLAAATFKEFVIGVDNLPSEGNPTQWVATDPLFVIGNGYNLHTKSNALVMLKNGDTTLNGNLEVKSMTIQAPAAGIPMGEFGMQAE